MPEEQNLQRLIRQRRRERVRRDALRDAPAPPAPPPKRCKPGRAAFLVRGVL